MQWVSRVFNKRDGRTMRLQHGLCWFSMLMEAAGTGNRGAEDETYL